MEKGYYVNLSKDKQGNLVLKPTRNARRERKEIQAMGETQALLTLLEDHLCNGLDWVDPAEVGALTDAPILSDSMQTDDLGHVTAIESVFWFPSYEIEDPIELFFAGSVTFIKAGANNE